MWLREEVESYQNMLITANLTEEEEPRVSLWTDSLEKTKAVSISLSVTVGHRMLDVSRQL